MRVIPQITFTDAILTSSTCAEPHASEQVYNNGSTYALGARVILGSPTSAVAISNATPGVVSWATHGLPDGTPVVLTTTGALPAGLAAGRMYYVINSAAGTFQVSEAVNGLPINTTSAGSGTHTAKAQVHRTYESLQASNSGKPPALPASAAWWTDVGPTNRWAALDLEQNTGTIHASPLTMVFAPGQRIDALGLVGLVADQVQIDITNGGVPVYSRTINLSTRIVLNWYDWTVRPFTYRAGIALFDLPSYSNPIVTITLTRASGDVTCAGIIPGLQTYLGATIHNAESDSLNFSKIDRNDYGKAKLVRRASVPRSTQQVRCPKENVDLARDLRTAISGVPALWCGIDDQTSGYFEGLLISGVHKRFTIAFDRPDSALISLELEEV